MQFPFVKDRRRLRRNCSYSWTSSWNLVFTFSLIFFFKEPPLGRSPIVMCFKSTLGNKKLRLLIAVTNRQNQSPRSALELWFCSSEKAGKHLMLKKRPRTSRVVPWLRIHLPMQETRVWSLVRSNHKISLQYIHFISTAIYVTPLWLSGKESACQCRRCRFHPWVGKIPWRRKWQPTPVFLPGKSHRQRAWQELDMTD